MPGLKGPGFIKVFQALAAGLEMRPDRKMRFGFAPLYIDDADVVAAVDVLEDILRNQLWDTPDYKQKSRVT